MKRFLILLLVVLLALSPRLFWSFKESKQLTVNVIDKTVPKKDYREHNGLFQVLDYEKVIDASGELYDIGKDYFGFDPYDKVPGPIYKTEKTPDLIYVTDTYGVYDDDLDDIPDGERSTIIDGGMTLLEWNAIMASKSEETTLIAEFNSFASPTEESVSNIMQKNLGVQWTGWTGRYFPDFSNEEVPAWLIQEYEAQYEKSWNFTNEGIALNHSSGKVVILDHKASEGIIEFAPTAEGKKQFSSMGKAPYMYWFDIVEPNTDTTELARYTLNLSEKGTALLKDAGIPTEFPAIVHNANSKTYYFAGDFADFDKRAFTKWQLFPKFYQLFATDTSEFYWNSYFPMLSKILNEISDEKVE